VAKDQLKLCGTAEPYSNNYPLRRVSKIALYQGMALAVPQSLYKFMGFSPCPAAAKAVIWDRCDGTTGR
jgi:hypothetical protein